MLVGQQLGHKTPRMTARYAHLSPGFMQSTVAKLDQNFLEEAYNRKRGTVPFFVP
jgi:hypothetical protein